MRLDPLISRHLEALTTKAVTVSKTRKQRSSQSSDYFIDYPLFQEWATNALSLLEKSFGLESIHFTQLSKHCEHCQGFEKRFEACRSIFKAAREDYEGGYLFHVR